MPADDKLEIAGGAFTTVLHDYSLPAGGSAQQGTLIYQTATLGSGVIQYTGVGTVNMAVATDTDQRPRWLRSRARASSAA